MVVPVKTRMKNAHTIVWVKTCSLTNQSRNWKEYRRFRNSRKTLRRSSKLQIASLLYHCNVDCKPAMASQKRLQHLSLGISKLSQTRSSAFGIESWNCWQSIRSSWLSSCASYTKKRWENIGESTFTGPLWKQETSRSHLKTTWGRFIGRSPSRNACPLLKRSRSSRSHCPRSINLTVPLRPACSTLSESSSSEATLGSHQVPQAELYSTSLKKVVSPTNLANKSSKLCKICSLCFSKNATSSHLTTLDHERPTIPSKTDLVSTTTEVCTYLSWCTAFKATRTICDCSKTTLHFSSLRRCSCVLAPTRNTQRVT